MKHYKPQVKAKIVETTKAARAEGKKWKQAHEEAKGVGYKGSLAALVGMLRDVERAAGKVVKSKGKPGRKPGRKAGYTKLDPVAKFVNKLVEQKLKERVRKAIAALKGI